MKIPANRQLMIPGLLLLSLASQDAMAIDPDDLTINGYFSFEYEKRVSGDDIGDPYGSFDLDLIDLVFNFRATDNFRVATDLTWEHGTATEDGRGNVAIEYAFAEYQFSDAVKFRAGKMFAHFGINNEIHTAKPATLSVKVPRGTARISKMGAELDLFPRWVTGIAATGDLVLADRDFNYMVQMANGEYEDDDGTNPHEEDINTNKALFARARYQVNDEVRIGVSIFDDKAYFADYGQELNTTSYGVEVLAEWLNGFGVQAEYAAGSFEGEQDSTAVDYGSAGYHVQAHYRMNEMFTPYFRYEWADPDDTIDDDEANIIILGVNIAVNPRFFLKVELDHFSGDPNNSDFPDQDGVELKASVSVGF